MLTAVLLEVALEQMQESEGFTSFSALRDNQTGNQPHVIKHTLYFLFYSVFPYGQVVCRMTRKAQAWPT